MQIYDLLLYSYFIFISICTWQKDTTHGCANAIQTNSIRRYIYSERFFFFSLLVIHFVVVVVRAIACSSLYRYDCHYNFFFLAYNCATIQRN